jgi:lysophospholipase L1-like esterase
MVYTIYYNQTKLTEVTSLPMTEAPFYTFIESTYTALLFETHNIIERSLLQLLIILELLIVFYIIMRTLRSVRFLVSEKMLIKKTYSFETSPKVTTSHFVLFGDSTAYGTGTMDQHSSVAGRLAHDFPHAHIDNKAENGAGVKDVLQKIYEGGEQFYDLAIILIGGNDVVFLTSKKSIRHDLTVLLKKAKEMTNNNVILVSPMNVGSSRMFWFPINIFYEWRSRVVRRVFHSVSRSLDVPLVDLFVPRSVDFFAEYPGLYFAPDNIHYSGEGYGHIYEEVKDVINKRKMVKE